MSDKQPPAKQVFGCRLKSNKMVIYRQPDSNPVTPGPCQQTSSRGCLAPGTDTEHNG